MITNVDDMKESMDAAMKSFGAVSKYLEAITAEIADYSKKTFEESTQTFEKLVGTKSVEKGLEMQQSYLKGAYEGFVFRANKIGELYAEFAKEAYKPFEGYLQKMTPAK
jgi:hypothetical protein